MSTFRMGSMAFTLSFLDGYNAGRNPSYERSGGLLRLATLPGSIDLSWSLARKITTLRGGMMSSSPVSLTSRFVTDYKRAKFGDAGFE
jgi:hypothetical protein